MFWHPFGRTRARQERQLGVLIGIALIIIHPNWWCVTPHEKHAKLAAKLLASKIQLPLPIKNPHSGCCYTGCSDVLPYQIWRLEVTAVNKNSHLKWKFVIFCTKIELHLYGISIGYYVKIITIFFVPMITSRDESTKTYTNKIMIEQGLQPQV